MSGRQSKARHARRLMHGRSAGAAIGGGLLVAGGLVSATAAQATPAHVEVFSDSGAEATGTAATALQGNNETLADAILYLNGDGGGTITFASSLSGHTIDLEATLPEITANTTVTGLGAGKLALDGAVRWHIFGADGNAALSVSGLTLEAADGSAVYADNGNVTVTNSVLEGNYGAGVDVEGTAATKDTLSGDTIKNNGGPGVYIGSAATLTLSHSIVENNQYGVGTYGGPTTIMNSSIVDNGLVGRGYGGVRAVPYDASDPLTIVNSTISGNVKTAERTDLSGAGIAVGPGIDLTLIGDTVTHNRADNNNSTVGTTATGGGISSGLIDPGGSTASKLTVEDSVIAVNTVVAATGPADALYPDIAIAPTVTSEVEDSLIGAGATAADTDTALTFGAGAQKGTTARQLRPELGPLGPHGSSATAAGSALLLQEPLKGSPLTGKGAAKPFSTKLDPFTTDELGTARPSKDVTIGAYEVPAPKPKPKQRK